MIVVKSESMITIMMILMDAGRLGIVATLFEVPLSSEETTT